MKFHCYVSFVPEWDSFDGTCEYGNGKFDRTSTDSASGFMHCQHKCEYTTGCTAVSYNPTNNKCRQYRGGPYSGDGTPDNTCYVRPGILVLTVYLIMSFTQSLHNYFNNCNIIYN